MNIILLSGGSGKRLWPLSNDIRSKQLIKSIASGCMSENDREKFKLVKIAGKIIERNVVINN